MGCFPPKIWNLCRNEQKQSAENNFCLVSLILDSEKETSLWIFSAKISRTTFKYHLIVVFWCSALHKSQWLRQESLKVTIRSPFYLLVSCVWRLLLTKRSLWNAPQPKFGVFLHTILQPLFYSSPISRLGYNLC